MSDIRDFVIIEMVCLPWCKSFVWGDWALEVYVNLPVFHDGITGVEVDVWTPVGNANFCVDRLTAEDLKEGERWN